MEPFSENVIGLSVMSLRGYERPQYDQPRTPATHTDVHRPEIPIYLPVKTVFQPIPVILF